MPQTSTQSSGTAARAAGSRAARLIAAVPDGESCTPRSTMARSSGACADRSKPWATTRWARTCSRVTVGAATASSFPFQPPGPLLRLGRGDETAGPGHPGQRPRARARYHRPGHIHPVGPEAGLVAERHRALGPALAHLHLQPLDAHAYAPGVVGVMEHVLARGRAHQVAVRSEEHTS